VSEDKFTFINTVKGNSLKNELPFTISLKMMKTMKEAILGKDYQLSVAIIDDTKMKELNNRYRNINTTTDILSFPLPKKEGEIFLSLKQCKIKAKEFDRHYENYLPFLFIHGLVHLNGMSHGSRMESEEQKWRNKFGI
jgi:probable rRNA maturation factor